MRSIKRKNSSRTDEPGGAPAGHLRVNRMALHAQAVDRLRKLIVRGTLAPGAQINEGELADALGISRTPLREALKLLASESLIELRPNRSARVSMLRTKDLEELFEAVAGIERIAAELAAKRITPRDLTRLGTLQSRMERLHAGNALEEYFEINQQIHRFIVACAANSALKATHDWLLSRAERARFFALASQSRWDESVKEHQAIFNAIEARNSAQAGKLLDRHVKRTGKVVCDVLRAKRKAANPEAAAAA
jgi:DNA-binding GntR family transcriptional regulator